MNGCRRLHCREPQTDPPIGCQRRVIQHHTGGRSRSLTLPHSPQALFEVKSVAISSGILAPSCMTGREVSSSCMSLREGLVRQTSPNRYPFCTQRPGNAREPIEIPSGNSLKVHTDEVPSPPPAHQNPGPVTRPLPETTGGPGKQAHRPRSTGPARSARYPPPHRGCRGPAGLRPPRREHDRELISAVPAISPVMKARGRSGPPHAPSSKKIPGANRKIGVDFFLWPGRCLTPRALHRGSGLPFMRGIAQDWFLVRGGLLHWFCFFLLCFRSPGLFEGSQGPI